MSKYSINIIVLSNDILSRVRRIDIIDLSSRAALSIPRHEKQNVELILEATKIKQMYISKYANELIGAIINSSSSAKSLRESLYTSGFRKDFDLVDHSDAGVIEVTVRHL